MAKSNILAAKMAALVALQAATQDAADEFENAVNGLRDFVATATAKAKESGKTVGAVWNEYKYRAELAIKYAMGENRKGNRKNADDTPETTETETATESGDENAQGGND